MYYKDTAIKSARYWLTIIVSESEQISLGKKILKYSKYLVQDNKFNRAMEEDAFLYCPRKLDIWIVLT